MKGKYLKIEREYLYIALLILPFFQPWWLTTIKTVDILVDVWKLLVVLYVILMIGYKKVKISYFTLIFTLYRSFVFAISVYHYELSVDIGYLKESIFLISYLITFEHLMKKSELKVLQTVLFAFAVNLLFNLITYTPDGIFFDRNSGYYLLGIRTRIAELAIPAMGLAIYYSKRMERLTLICVVISISSICFFIIEWVATAISMVVLFFALIFIENLIFERLKKTYHISLFISASLSSIAVVFFKIQEKFDWLISGLLHKKITLTGRTEIWDVAKDIITSHWLIGHGFKNQGDFVQLYDFITTSHNQYLQTMYYGGIIGSLFYYMLPLISLKRIIKVRNHSRDYSILIITLCVIFVMGTTEICMDNVYYLTFICYMYHVPFIKRPDINM